MNQTNPKTMTRGELHHYLYNVLGFTRVKTATPGQRLYAHLVPGTKRLWIPLELTGSERDLVNKVMTYSRSVEPSPSKMPDRFKIRKVGKKVQIYEEREPEQKRAPREYERPRPAIPKPKSMNEQISNASRKMVFKAIDKIVAKERKELRETRERTESSRRVVQNAIERITAEEKKLKDFVKSMIDRIVAQQRQAERNRQTPPTSERPYAGPRIRTSARNMYKHKEVQPIKRNIANSLTYQRLRNQGHSDKVARQLIDIFEEEADIEWPEPPKKEAGEDLADYLARWEEDALKYSEPEEYVPVEPSGPPPEFKPVYHRSVQIPVQLRRRHIPNYKLYK